MSEALFLREIDGRGVARLTLNRPDVHNAFNDVLIADLTAALEELEADPLVRIVVLASRGRNFSAGADLGWMKRMAANSQAENQADARRLAGLMRRLNDLAKPTLALVQGPAFGGGVGLVACCDIVIAVEGASFCLSEVKLGLIPAAIGPYVMAAIGPRAARRYFLSAETFSAAQAERLGLVHQVVASKELETAAEDLLKALLKAGPVAQAAAKDLVKALSGRTIDDALVEDTALRIARLRAGPEAREGIAAFLEKRKPDWRGN